MPSFGSGGSVAAAGEEALHEALDHPLLLGGQVEVFPGEAGRQALLGLQVVEGPPPGGGGRIEVVGVGGGSVVSSGPGAGPPARSRSIEPDRPARVL